MRGWDREGLIWGEVPVDRRAAFPGGFIIYYCRKGVVCISYLWQDSVVLWRNVGYDPDLFTVSYERVILDGVTAVETCAADETGRATGKLVVYLRDGVSTAAGEPYGGEPLCVPGDRLIPWTGAGVDGMPADGGYRILSVERRTHGSPAIRHTKIVAI